MSTLDLKQRLINSRKFEKESDYQVVEEIYRLYNSSFFNEKNVEILMYRLDDNSEDLESTNSLIEIIFSMSEKGAVSELLSLIVLSNITACMPHTKLHLKRIIGIVISQENIENFLALIPICQEKTILNSILQDLNEDENFNTSWIFRKNLIKSIFKITA